METVVESALCLCSEGPDFYKSGELLEAVKADLLKAFSKQQEGAK